MLLSSALRPGPVSLPSGYNFCYTNEESTVRRQRFDPLAGTARPHWLTVADMHQKLIAYEALPAWADLRDVLRAALAQYAAEGWEIENDGAYGFAFIVRQAERRLVNLTPADPSAHAGPGHACVAGRGVVDRPIP